MLPTLAAHSHSHMLSHTRTIILVVRRLMSYICYHLGLGYHFGDLSSCCRFAALKRTHSRFWSVRTSQCWFADRKQCNKQCKSFKVINLESKFDCLPAFLTDWLLMFLCSCVCLLPHHCLMQFTKQE